MYTYTHTVHTLLYLSIYVYTVRTHIHITMISLKQSEVKRIGNVCAVKNNSWENEISVYILQYWKIYIAILYIGDEK